MKLFLPLCLCLSRRLYFLKTLSYIPQTYMWGLMKIIKMSCSLKYTVNLQKRAGIRLKYLFFPFGWNAITSSGLCCLCNCFSLSCTWTFYHRRNTGNGKQWQEYAKIIVMFLAFQEVPSWWEKWYCSDLNVSAPSLLRTIWLLHVC